MKTLFTILLVSLCMTGFGINWTLYGPAGVHANNILFGAGNHNYTVICTNNGVCVNNGVASAWNTVTFGLPVWEAIPYDTNNILLVLGAGSYSDGIYKFNLTTNTFNVIEWLYIPTFIKYSTNNNKYYVGSRYNGMLCSADGITWDTISYFQSKGCSDMDFYGQHIVVTQENNIYATYYSNNGGSTWNQSSSNIPIHALAFDQNGILYGVFTGNSNSSGLYISNDFGCSWNMEQFIDNMNTVGFDVMNNLFTGFHGALAPYGGVAIYDTLGNNFSFLNTNLPNKNINKFKINPIMSSITIFACTDSGVYFCNDYLSSINNNNFPENNVNIYPNPAKEKIIIESLDKSTIEIFNTQGQIIKKYALTSKKAMINISKLSSGVYLIRVKTNKGATIKKFVKQ